MIKLRTTMEGAFRIIKLVTTVSACWPIAPDAKPLDVWLHTLRWWVVFLNSGWCSYIVFYNIYLRRNSFDDAMKCTVELIALFSILGKMLICKVEASCLQGLLAESHMFLKRATKEQMKTIQFYVDKCYVVHLIGYVFFSLGPVLFMIGPAVLEQPFPSDDLYPFSTEPFWIWLIGYTSQCCMLLQVGATMSITYMYAMLLWYAVAKFEINCLEFQSATTSDDLRRCILNHQEVIEFTDRLRQTTRPMLFSSVIVNVLSMSIGGFMLTRNPPLIYGIEYSLYYLGSTLQFFTMAWPADSLLEAGMKIGDSAYSSNWIGKLKMVKDIVLIVQRSQIPLDISYDGLLPPVSLNLFRVSLSASFSYLATLRAMADN